VEGGSGGGGAKQEKGGEADRWKPWERSDVPSWARWMAAWSLHDNIASILTPRLGSPWASLDGARILSMAMVILGHSCLAMLGAGVANLLAIAPPEGDFGDVAFQPVEQSEFAVDTFFILSGFLTTAMLLPTIRDAYSGGQGYAGAARVGGVAVLHRAVRLLPVLIVMLLTYRYLLPALGSGPLWAWTVRPTQGYPGQKDELAWGAVCDRWMWTNMLFINNLVPWEDNWNHMCAGWTWFLANDMQFFVLFVLLAVATAALPQVYFFASWLALFVASCVAATVVSAQEHLIPFIDRVPPHNEPDTQRGSFTDLYYSKPWMRAPPFIVGIFLGMAWIVYAGPKGAKSRPQVTIPQHVGLAIIAAAAAVISFLMYIPATYYRWAPPPPLIHSSADYRPTSPWSVAAETVWTAWSRPLFSVAMAAILGVCIFGGGGLVDAVLSWTLWQPLAKLTYAAYLFHYPMLVFFYNQQLQPFSYSGTLLSSIFPGNWLWAYGVALLVNLLVEKPFINLEAFFKSLRSTSSKHHDAHQDPRHDDSDLREPLQPRREVEEVRIN
jgi:peptidoglycan/LPS O-acetylase OafA/YrhL